MRQLTLDSHKAPLRPTALQLITATHRADGDDSGSAAAAPSEVTQELGFVAMDREATAPQLDLQLRG